MNEIFSHNVFVGRDDESDLVYLSGLDWEGQVFRVFIHPTEEAQIARELGIEVFEGQSMFPGGE